MWNGASLCTKLAALALWASAAGGCGDSDGRDAGPEDAGPIEAGPADAGPQDADVDAGAIGDGVGPLPEDDRGTR